MPVAGRDVVPNVPDLFGGLAFERLVRTRREGRENKPIIPRSRGARKTSGTLRTASFPIMGVATFRPQLECVCSFALSLPKRFASSEA